MFFRRRATPAPEPAGEVRSSTTLEAGATAAGEDALDALGDVLRAYGEHGTDTDEDAATRTKSTFERWASHVLVGAPLDDSQERGARDLRGAVRFFRKHRKQEAERVTQSIGTMRDAVWAFLSVLSKATHDDGRSDRAMRGRIEQLRESIASGDPERLRAAADGTVQAIAALLDARSEAQRARMQELAEQVRALGRELEEAKREGELDALTRLYNRACFDRFVERTCSMAFLGTPACLLMCDVDHFKKVNDTFGHPGGDAVLRAVADTLFRAFPRRDDLVARYGGEEFAVILRNTRRADAEALADRLVRAVRKIVVPLGGKEARPTLSIGVAEIAAGESAEGWISRADAALYRAKGDGRDRFAAAT